MNKAKGALGEMPAEYRREDLGPIVHGKFAAQYAKATTAEAAAKPALGRGLRAQRGVRITLRALREAAGKTQRDVADASGIDYEGISELEKRVTLEECQVSTLQRYLAALGGRLDLAVVFGAQQIVVVGVQTEP